MTENKPGDRPNNPSGTETITAYFERLPITEKLAVFQDKVAIYTNATETEWTQLRPVGDRIILIIQSKIPQKHTQHWRDAHYPETRIPVSHESDLNLLSSYQLQFFSRIQAFCDHIERRLEWQNQSVQTR